MDAGSDENVDRLGALFVTGEIACAAAGVMHPDGR
jgi:hypothetical protein